MNNRLLEAYAYYRKQYPSQAIVFKRGTVYYICCEKAVFPDMEFEHLQNDFYLYRNEAFTDDKVFDLFKNAHLPVRVISYLNKNKEYDIPDINQIISEKEEDY